MSLHVYTCVSWPDADRMDPDDEDPESVRAIAEQHLEAMQDAYDAGESEWPRNTTRLLEGIAALDPTRGDRGGQWWAWAGTLNFTDGETLLKATKPFFMDLYEAGHIMTFESEEFGYDGDRVVCFWQDEHNTVGLAILHPDGHINTLQDHGTLWYDWG